MLVLAILKLPSEEESFPPEHLCEIENLCVCICCEINCDNLYWPA